MLSLRCVRRPSRLGEEPLCSAGSILSLRSRKSRGTPWGKGCSSTLWVTEPGTHPLLQPAQRYALHSSDNPPFAMAPGLCYHASTACWLSPLA